MPGNDVASDNGEEGASFAIDGNDVMCVMVHGVVVEVA
jgi:hypothetical protein